MIFDGHNDVLTNLYQAGEGVDGFLTSLPGHIDLPRARSGGFGGGFSGGGGGFGGGGASGGW
jgi:uncharacterized membrane protein YgcG